MREERKKLVKIILILQISLLSLWLGILLGYSLDLEIFRFTVQLALVFALFVFSILTTFLAVALIILLVTETKGG